VFVPTEVDEGFESRRRALVVHFKECCRLGGGVNMSKLRRIVSGGLPVQRMCVERL